MPDILDSIDKDAVLSAFLEACPVPSPEDVAQWRRRHPEFSTEIMELAADLIFLSNNREDDPAHEDGPEQEEEDYLVALQSFRAAEQRLAREQAASGGRDGSVIGGAIPQTVAEAEGGARDWQTTFGGRLKAARQSQRLSENAVLEGLGSARDLNWLGSVESNAVHPDDESIAALSRVLSVSPGYLCNRGELYLIDVSPRNGHRLTADELQWVEIEAIDYAQDCLRLDEIFGERFEALETVPMRTVTEIEKAALGIRAAWGVGDAPIESLTAELENRGTKVILLDLGKGDGFAMRINESGRPRTQVIVVGRGWPIERRRFTLAHELAHLLAPNVSESIANHFAGALLLPADVVRARFPNSRDITVPAAIRLKEEYGVSLQAIAYRCKDVGLIDGARVAELFEAFNNSRPSYGQATLESFSEMPARYARLRRKARALGFGE